jgi:NTP pyrophosphatase (non-canonical NTP hydrolase)
MNKEGYYFSDREKISDKYTSTKEHIADEVADILYATVRIADYYAIDILAASKQARIEEDDFLKSKGV